MGWLAEQQRKHLEHMMGPEAMGVVQVDLKLTDPKVCRNFICGNCPHDLFTNTKMDLGACPHTHLPRLKEEFNNAFKLVTTDTESTADLHYTLAELNSLKAEYERNITNFVDDCDRRIRTAQKRLEKTPEENNRSTALMREIGEIQTAYEAAMAEVEALGESGKVEESMTELSKAEALKVEKVTKESELQQLIETSGASGHQKLRVCDICGAYLSILDSDRRLADHFGGKMHLGYLSLRQLIEEWKSRPINEVPKLLPKATAPTSGAFANSNGSANHVPVRDNEHKPFEGGRDRGYVDRRRDDDRRRPYDDGNRDRGYNRERRDYDRNDHPRRDRDYDNREPKRSRYD